MTFRDDQWMRRAMSSVWMAYADDSGDEDISLHSALLLPIEKWSDGLAEWKKYRWALQRKHKVPTERELHASDWITGKDNPAPKGEPVNTTVGIRREWSRKALLAIRKMQGARVFTVTSPTPVKADAYCDFLLQLDGAMRDCGDRVVLIMDGDRLSA